MPNMGNIITKNSNKLVFQSLEQPTRMCNCRDKASCPRNGNCLQICFAYQAQVDGPNLRKHYLGMSENEFKTRYNNHIMSFWLEVIKRKLNFQNIFGTWKTTVKLLLSNEVLLQKPSLANAVVNGVTYAWWKNCLLPKLIHGHY